MEWPLDNNISLPQYWYIISIDVIIVIPAHQLFVITVKSVHWPYAIGMKSKEPNTAIHIQSTTVFIFLLQKEKMVKQHS